MSPDFYASIVAQNRNEYNVGIELPQGGSMIDRITVDPEIHFGKPRVVGTRVTVQDVLELLDEDLSFDDIIEGYYPDLTPEDIRACIQYAIALVAAEDIHLTTVPA